MSATANEKAAKKSALTSLSDAANLWSERILFILMLLMVIVTTAQVVCRFFFKALTWSEELSCFLLVLASLVGTAVAFKRGSHIAVTFVIEKLNPTAKKAMATVVDLLGLGFFGIVAWYGAVLMKTEASQITPALQVSMKWVYLIYPLVGIVIMIHILDSLVAVWTRKEAAT
jgi:TRAP-type transport system small permease protein